MSEFSEQWLHETLDAAAERLGNLPPVWKHALLSDQERYLAEQKQRQDQDLY